MYGHKGSTDQHATMQQLRDGRHDSIVLFVQNLTHDLTAADCTHAVLGASSYLQGFLLGTRRALRQKGRPNLLLTLPTIDAYNIGALIAFSERVVSLYVDLVGVNGYDQPGVEAGKTAAKEILALRERVLTALDQGPATLTTLEALAPDSPNDVFYILEREIANQEVERTEKGFTKKS